jgi:uncharacterized protein YegJ (DUF2314 family)
MSEPNRKITSLVALLRQPRRLELAEVQRAAEFAFREAPESPKVFALKNRPGFGVRLGPLPLVVFSLERPYFKNIAEAADRISVFAAKRAVQAHAAWLSVDVVGEPPEIDQDVLYRMLGKLLAEFLQDDVLGIIRWPDGAIVGYDFSFIPFLREGKTAAVFHRGPPDRIIKAGANNAELTAATADARQRWGEFLAAFTNRRPQQGFGVKKAFTEDGRTEHMWVTVTRIEGSIIHGWLSNTPGMIKSLKARDPVQLSESEVEDWIYSDGKQNVGGFHAKVLKKRG